MTKGTVVALGFFDGVHIAHQDVLNEAAAAARELSVESVAITFDQHPLKLINGIEPPLLCTPEERALYIRKYTDIDRVEVLHFDHELMEFEPEAFIKRVLCEKFNAVCVCAGFDYTFGKGGRGNAELLKSICEKLGISCRIVKAHSYKGEKISSTAIRELLQNGDAETAAELLGRPYSFSGIIRHGKALGRTLGFPTINVPMPPELVLPAAGVYVCLVDVGGEYNSVCNIAHGDKPLCEAHILFYKGDLYGQRAEIKLLTRLRGMRHFEDFEKLREQVEKDKKSAENWFIERPVL